MLSDFFPAFKIGKLNGETVLITEVKNTDSLSIDHQALDVKNSILIIVIEIQLTFYELQSESNNR